MSYRTTLKFDGTEKFFDGHFPGFPILPGVVQLAEAQRHAFRMMGREAVLKSVKKMKFVHVIRPGDEVTLELEEKGKGEIAYSFAKGGVPCSSGVLVF